MILKSDIDALFKGNLCTEAEMAKCLEEMDESELSWACENCPKKKHDEIHEYTRKLLNYRLLTKAGFPLTANDLTYEEWLDLGKINIWLQTPEQ